MPINEQPCFNCGRLPSEGHTARCIADFQEPETTTKIEMPSVRVQGFDRLFTRLSEILGED